MIRLHGKARFSLASQLIDSHLIGNIAQELFLGRSLALKRVLELGALADDRMQLVAREQALLFKIVKFGQPRLESRANVIGLKKTS